MLKVRTAAPMGLRHRTSPDSAWPLRRADGRTWAEGIPAWQAAEIKKKEQSK